MIRARWGLWVGLLVISAGGRARADRAPGPTDTLGDWAVEPSVGLGGVGQHHLVSTEDGPEFRRVTSSRLALAVRVWPIEGLHVRAEQAFETVGDDPDKDDLDGPHRTVDDLRLGAGYRTRLGPSVVVGAGVDMVAATGSGVAADGLTDVSAELVVGFSFNEYWDFYFRPRIGARRGADGDPRSGERAGYVAGAIVAGQGGYLGLYGFNEHHFEARKYLGTGGGVELGVELRPGLTVSAGVEGEWTEDYVLAPRRYVDRVAAMIRVTGVFFPTGRTNELRKSDERRGHDWVWWERP